MKAVFVIAGALVIGSLAGLALRHTSQVEEQPAFAGIEVKKANTHVLVIPDNGVPELFFQPELVVEPIPESGSSSTKLDAPAPTQAAPAMDKVKRKKKPTAKPDVEKRPDIISTSSIVGFTSHSDAELARLLSTVPKVSLLAVPNHTLPNKERADAYTAQVRDVASGQAQELEFKVPKSRPDLAGLPFLKGNACRLSKEDSRNLARYSSLFRRALTNKDRSSLSAAMRGAGSDAIPVYFQILSGDSYSHRCQLMVGLTNSTSSESTATLANRAVFENSSTLRKRAINALMRRKTSESTNILRKGLRYPWQPAVDQAAEVVVTLRMKEMAPFLVDCLDQPEPAAPFKGKLDGKEGLLKREMVRINHLRNCLLCHPSSIAGARRRLRGMVLGAVPSMGSPLPPPSLSRAPYYQSASQGTGVFVRAEVSYLRQDFSVMQRVRNSAPWPNMQRFDFLVRTRQLNKAELVNLKQPRPQGNSRYHRTILAALRALTEQDHGLNTADWREYLLSKSSKVERDGTNQ